MAIHNRSSSSTIDIPRSEKLLDGSSIVQVDKQRIEELPPHPFVTEMRGTPPSGFILQTPTVPQYLRHINPGQNYPKSIQDIINSVNQFSAGQVLYREQLRNKGANNRVQFFGTYGQPQHLGGGYGQLQSFNLIPTSVSKPSFIPNPYYNYGYFSTKSVELKPAKSFTADPFFAFKPQDPSDINLLSDGDFRFAPPAVNTFIKKKKYVERQVAATTSSTKPVKLTLKLFSGEKTKLNPESPFVPRYIPLQDEGSYYGKKTPKANQMVVHLNLYSDPGAYTNSH